MLEKETSNKKSHANLCVTSLMSIIIPCFNENNHIPTLIAALEEFISKWFSNYEIIIVNDGSTDNTSLSIENSDFFNQLKKTEHFQYVKLNKNKGKGGALKAGVDRASGDYILTMDADISTHPLELINWTFDKNSIIIASRAHKNSQLKEKKYRKFIGIVFNFLVRKITGINVRDSQCGFKLYPGSIAKTLFSNLITDGWAHDVEILCRAKQSGIEIIEMPIKWTVKNDSKVKVLSDSIKMFLQILKIKLFILKKPLIKNEIKEDS